MILLARRSVALLASTAVMTLLVTGGYPLGAQEKGAARSQASKAKQSTKIETPAQPESGSKAKSTGKAPPDPTHRVPPGYSKLGLTDQQKEAIYKIQAKYYPQLQALEKQATALRARRETEFQGVLTPSQKQRLSQQEREKKAAAEAKRAARAAESEKDK
jgi:hypothetical protein